MLLDTYKYLVIYRFWTLSGWLLIPATLMVTCRPPEVSKISCHLRPRRPVNFPFWENRKAEQEEPNPDHTANELDQNVKNLPSIWLQTGGAHGTGKTQFVCFLKFVGLLQSDAAVLPTITVWAAKTNPSSFNYGWSAIKSNRMKSNGGRRRSDSTGCAWMIWFNKVNRHQGQGDQITRTDGNELSSQADDRRSGARTWWR